jgi:hypothetical protein
VRLKNDRIVVSSMTMPEDERRIRTAPSPESAEVIDGGVVGSRYWLHSQPMPMVGRPCTCVADKLMSQMEKLPVYPSAWCWTDEAENVLEGMSWLRSDSKANAASVAPELESWIMQNPNSWLIIDGRGNRIPGAGGRLEELLRNLATTVVMIVDEIDKAHPFPAWEFPL